MKLKNYITVLGLLVTAILAVSCGKSKPDFTQHNNDTGMEYAPQMYYSAAYEHYSQGEYNPYNEGGSNMRQPVVGTVSRQAGSEKGLILELMYNYPIAKDCVVIAEKLLRNPIPMNKTTLAEGKVLYTKYCTPCHGAEGNGQGLVGLKYGGVANFNAGNLKATPSGHYYHTITMGKGRMWSHASQVLPADRWKIVHYVNQLRGYDDPYAIKSLSQEEIEAQTEIVEVDGKVVIRFPFGSAVSFTNNKLEKYLKTLAEKSAKTGKLMRIEGHTDNVGDVDGNYALGQERADYVKNQLINYGSNGSNMSSSSFSSKVPAASNDTEDGRRQNRRVEIIFE